MVGISIKITLPKKKLADAKWLENIARYQRSYSVPILKALFQKTVFGWKEKPTFGYVQIRSANTISIKMYPTGAASEIWNLVNAGSPEHPISPKVQGGMLRFQKGYRSATVPGSLQSRRAYRSNPVWTARTVWHPGFKARKFTSLIEKEYKKSFAKEMQEAIKIAAKEWL